MIDCPNGDVRDVLPEYANDTLDSARRLEVERHVISCAACREELELLHDLRATIRHAPAVDVGAIAAAIPPYRAPAPRAWTRDWRAAAAVAAIAIGGASIALLRDDRPATPAGPLTVAVQPTPARDSIPESGGPGSSAVPAARPSAPSPPRSSPPVSRELAMAGGTIGELSDSELSALVDAVESLDAVPSAEVDGAEPVSLGAQEES
jgi:hypothetical protein